MPYIGRGPQQSGAFRIIDDISGDFNGVLTSFALEVGSAALTVGLPETLLIAVDGVIQEAGSAYTISGSNIVFTAAPQAAATFWGVELGDVGGLADSAVKQAANDDTTKVATTSWVQDELDGYAADTATFTNKTFDVEATGNSVSNIDVANLKSGVLDTDISSVSGSDDTLASAKSIKTYVDAQVTANNLDITDGSTTIEIDANSEALTITSGEGIDATVSGNALTIAGEDATTSNKGVASFNTVNFLVSSGDVTIKDNGVRAAELYTTSGTAGSDTFLRGDETWAAAGGGALTLIESLNITSNTSNLIVDELDSSVYDSYLVVLSQMVPSSQPYAVLKLGDSSSIRALSGDYNWHHFAIRANSGSANHTNFVGGSEGQQIMLERRGVGTGTGEGFSASIWIHSRRTGDNTQFVRVHGTYSARTYLNETEGGMFIAETTAAMDLTRVQFNFAGASTESGRMTVYGVKHT